MTPEVAPEVVEEIEEELEYGIAPPESIGIADGETVIFDKDAFAAESDSWGLRVTGGQVWMLKRDGEDWTWIELAPPKQPKPRATLRSVKKDDPE
jgi:hypothetical protein